MLKDSLLPGAVNQRLPQLGRLMRMLTLLFFRDAVLIESQWYKDTQANFAVSDGHAIDRNGHLRPATPRDSERYHAPALCSNRQLRSTD
jgi:hypothetical protein